MGYTPKIAEPLGLGGILFSDKPKSFLSHATLSEKWQTLRARLPSAKRLK